MFEPRPYQMTAVRQVIALYEQGKRKMLLHLPTGSGKTVIAALIVDTLLKRLPSESKVLFVAHRKELLDQTVATLRRQIPGVSVSVEQGKRTASLSARVIVASIQSLIRRKQSYPAYGFSLIICDECHRALAPRWLEVIDYFHRPRRDAALLLGLTATPRRTDGRSAIAVFDTVAYAISKPELQDLGYLVPIEYWQIRTDIGLDQVKMAGSDFQAISLSARMNSTPVRMQTLRAWQAKGRGQKTLGFCASVAHAKQLAADFSAAGHRAAVVHGRSADRDALLTAFHAGAFDVLFNYNVLTEGYDDPSIQCLLLARPTTSPLVYNQCLGRGLRPHANKRTCTVIDIVDRPTHRLQYGACELAGLPERWRSRGRDPFRESRALQSVRVNDPDVFAAIQNASSLEQVQDLLMSVPPEAIVAGLDGEPVPYYEPVLAVEGDIQPDGTSSAPIHRTAAKRIVRRLLQRADARVRGIDITEATQSDGRMQMRIRLVDAHVDNERLGYLLWHLERATGYDIEYAPPARRLSRVGRPRALLRSLLSHGQRVQSCSASVDGKSITARVTGIANWQIERIEREFEQVTGVALYLHGQLAFDL